MWYPKTDLHRVEDRSDWELVPVSKRNAWQRLAAATHGLLTPANIISVLGALAVIGGLVLIYHGNYPAGLAWVAAGRLADIIDGIVAQRTGTKSTLGEALDVTIDKLTIILALIILVAADAVPILAALVIAMRNGMIMALGALAKMRRQPLHPNRAGKFAAALEWMAILCFVLAALFAAQQWEAAEVATVMLAYALLGLALLFGILAARGYGRPTIDR